MIIKAIKAARGYADFFSWPDRNVKERGIAHDWALSYYGKDKIPFELAQLKSRKEDPPDCGIVNSEGNLIGIEITELVDEETIRQWRRGESNDHADYPPDILKNRLADIIKEKDAKIFIGGPYIKKILIIFSAEDLVDTDENHKMLNETDFEKPNQFDEIFLKLQPRPRFGGEPPEKTLNESYIVIKLNTVT